MVLYVLNSFALLILAGVGVFYVLSNEKLRQQRLGQQAMIGLVMGVVVFIVSSDAYIVENMHAPLDSKVGPLVFAGYLGGPIGAFVAAAIGSVARISIGGDNTWLGVAYFFATALVGVVVARFIRTDEKTNVPQKAVYYLIAGALFIQFITMLLATWNNEGTPQTGPQVILLMSAANALSVSVMYFIIHRAHAIASSTIAAKENAFRLQLAMNAAKIGIFEREAGSDYVRYDKGLAHIWGLPEHPGVVPAEEAKAIIFEEDRPAAFDAMAATWAGRPPEAPIFFRIKRPDGEIRHVQASWAVEPVGGHKVERARAIYLDLTEVYQLQRQKEDAENRLSKIIEDLPIAFLSFVYSPTAAVEFKYISPNCRSIWGYTEEEFWDDPTLFSKLIHEDDLPGLRVAVTSTTETGEPFSKRFKITARNGELKYLDVRASASTSSDGRMQIDSFLLDVTAEVETQKKLDRQIAVAQQAQKNEAIGQLTGGVAHDFNNLLAIIIGNIELLQDTLTDKDQLDLANAAMTASEKGADLTRSLLAFARKSTLTPSLIDLNKTVLETKKWTARAIPSNIEIETHLLDGLWAVKADAGATESALLNLILNARDAISQSGTITIETNNIVLLESDVAFIDMALKPGRYVLLSVRDTGKGIPQETLEDIFEPFFTTKSVGSGSGLGLSMVQGFMQQSGGAVQVSSKAGAGTTVRLYFRASEEAVPSEREEKKPSVAALSQERILVAEDEPDLLSVIVNTLEMAGYRVTAARSGDEALELYKADPAFDLLLTDVVMPGQLRGTKLAEVIREIEPSLPVIFMSGYAGDATELDEGARPEDTKLMKPVQRQYLLSAIAKSLGTYGVERRGD
ncbi:ATP-binding protein [Yoonia maritima]|uniref:ATP-binding protein n=1 Tax=Yoonia maritima TaxID=1435347 RepID=UPI0037365838